MARHKRSMWIVGLTPGVEYWFRIFCHLEGREEGMLSNSILVVTHENNSKGGGLKGLRGGESIFYGKGSVFIHSSFIFILGDSAFLVVF